MQTRFTLGKIAKETAKKEVLQPYQLYDSFLSIHARMLMTTGLGASRLSPTAWSLAVGSQSASQKNPIVSTIREAHAGFETMKQQIRTDMATSQSSLMGIVEVTPKGEIHPFSIKRGS